ncbi:MAG: ABC transporter substrate-binding protein [Dactylosporangium sp.]|nr:ABC transporter substrate-binding protein [Dactylosporangium sp.]NNJ60402.1 ABC transporter substrate-binding protein [Dactylosporangium sp.]
MQVRRLTALAILPVVIAGGAAACSGDSDSGDSGNGSAAVLSVGIGEPKHIVPANTGETEGGQVVYAIFAGLLDYDKDGKPYNVIADSITTDDSKIWTIKLKDGFTFHNGEKVTSESFIDAWNWGAYGPNASDVNSYYAQIDGYADLNPEDATQTPASKQLSGLSKVDDLTFKITLSEAFSDFNTELGYTAFFPMPKAAFDSEGNITKEYEEAPIGNGPFKIKGTWNHDTNIETERFEGWKGTKPKIAGLNFRIYQDLKAQYSDTLANNLDINRQVDTSNLINAKNDFGDRYQMSRNSSFQFLAFPVYDETYAKAEVRKAISMAIDRDQMVKTVFADTQESARSFISPILPGYRDDTCGEACQYDPAAAKTLYQSVGGPATIQITYNADGGHKEWIEATCNQLQANLGITCQAQPETKFADMLTKVKDKTPGVGMFRLGWIMDYPSMYDYLQPLYHTNGSSNYYGYSNPEFDRLIAEGAAAKTSDEAIKLWQQAEDVLASDLPVIPLRYGQNPFVTSENVKKADINLFTWVDPYTVEAA